MRKSTERPLSILSSKRGYRHYSPYPLERDGLEAVKAKSVLQYGFLFGYGLPIIQNIYFNASAGPVGGGGIFALLSQNIVQYSFGQNFVGADFGFKILFGPDSLSGFNFKTGMHVGRSW